MRPALPGLVLALILSAPDLAAATEPKISIIIDDLGYALEAGRRAIELPGPTAVAILPNTPRGAELATTAHRQGKEVLLHLPLQAVDFDDPAGRGSLTLDMSRTAFETAFLAALASVPHVSGISSHRGSLLTRHPGHMSWLMQVIRARGGLYFVDSYTTHKSVALAMAREAGIVATRRDVFLDHDPVEAHIAREFERLKRLAREQGVAVGIGHPYPETLSFLEQALPQLEREGYRLVSIGEVVHPGPVAAGIRSR